MQKIFTARNEMDAHFLKGLLEAEGIQCVIQGEALEGAWGDLAITPNALPTLWVDEKSVARAQPIVAEYEARETAHLREQDDDEDEPAENSAAVAKKTWTCPKCGQSVEDQFDACWNCGTERPSEEQENR